MYFEIHLGNSISFRVFAFFSLELRIKKCCTVSWWVSLKHPFYFDQIKQKQIFTSHNGLLFSLTKQKKRKENKNFIVV